MIGSLHFSRSHIAFAHDVAMAALSFVVALWLRLGEGLFVSWSVPRLVAAAGLFALVAAGVFLSLRLYRGAVGLLPAPVLNLLLKIRDKIYARKEKVEPAKPGTAKDE